MILVDYREDSKVKGSRGLWDDLKHTNLPIEKAHLDGGDLMFIGNGPDGEVSVGVEFKKIRDLLQSIRTSRLQGHQFHKLADYEFRYLLVEGEWRHNESGMVTLRGKFGQWAPAPGRFSASELDKTLIGFPLRAGVYVWPVATRKDSILWLESLYRDFTDKPWDDHTSHTGIHRPAPLVPISGFRQAVTTFPRIGIKTSLTVEKHFKGSLRRAVAARPKEWEKIEGIGKESAERIDSFLEGGD